MRRVQGFDLLRGIAVLLVMLRHAFPSPFGGAGVVGVVMFFALSGYLITGSLLEELRTRGRLDLRRFYARRARRLVPALLLMMACFALVTLVLDPLGDRAELGRTVVVALTYTADLPFHHGSPAIFHLWTLALEEQFYLIWPAVLAIGWLRGRVGTALVLTGLGSLCGCVATLIWSWPHPDLAYPLPTSWAACFVIGAAARVHADRAAGLRSSGQLSSTTTIAAVLALTVLGGLSLVPLRGHAATYLVAAPVIALLTAVLLVSWREWNLVTARWLRPLVALGTISYGAYLWDYPLTLWLRASAAVGGTGAGLLAAGLTVIAASVSWRLIEQPVQRLVRGRVQEPAETDVRV